MIKFATPKGGAAGVFSLMLAASLLLFLPGCQGPLGVQETAGTGTLSVTVEGPPPGAQARTALPGGDLVYDFYELVFTFTPVPGNTGTFAPVTRPGDLGLIQIPGIPVGHWDLTVTAYLEGETEPTASYTYTGLNIASTGTYGPTEALSLSPVAGGYGEFRWDVTFPDTVTQFTVNVFEFDEWLADGDSDSLAGFPRQFESGTPGWSVSGGNVTVTGSHGDLPSGTYWVYFTLTDGEHTARPGTILRVYRNMVSVFDRTLAFDPATAPERAIRAINDHPAWGAVNQAWVTDTATTAAGALAQVQAQVNAVVAGLGAPAVVDWDSAAPTPGQTGIPAANIVFAVTVGGEETSITVSVAFLPSHAQAALAAITGALGTIEAAFTQPWLAAGTQATLNAATATVSGRVNDTITNATATVNFADAPNPTGAAIPEAPYVFTVVIVGTDTTTYTTTVTVPIIFAEDGVVVTQELEDLYAGALAMLGTAVASANGANIPMANLWTTPALRDALEQARTAAGLVLEAHETDDATQGEVDYAYGVLRSAYNAFRDARRAGRQELVAAHDALGDRVNEIAPQYVHYTTASWAPVVAAIGASNTLLGTNPLDLALADTALAGILTGLEDALGNLNTAFGGRVTLVYAARAALVAAIALAEARNPLDYGPAVRLAFTNALADAQAARDNATATAGELDTARNNLTTAMNNLISLVSARAALQVIIDAANLRSQANYTPASWTPFAEARAAAITAITNAETVAALQAAGTALSGAMTALVGQASGNFTITWPGFTNQMASVEISFVSDGAAGGTLAVMGDDAARLLNIRWYEGLSRLGTGSILTRNNMPPVVTVWAEVETGDVVRTYSLVVDVRNPPAGAGN